MKNPFELKKSDVASATLRDRSLLKISTILSLLLATTASANAQIIPDSTLPNNTRVAPNGQTIRIEGGTRSGGNLFHSFQDFNLGSGSTAFFNNAVDLKNIFSRVTGGNVSNIDGLIRANGTANLFFINPAGILFGPNARLNIGGSFLATSADSVIFDDGSFYSVSNTDTPPLLTINLPIGLQMGANPGAIIVRGTGHNLSRENDFVPIDRSSQLRAPTGLQVQPGNTLALVGGDIFLEGGILIALEGRIELGSIKQGNVIINPVKEPIKGWNFDYEEVQQFGDILMKERSLVDASSLLDGGGSIQVQGQNLELIGTSLIFIQNLGRRVSGNININTVESIAASGTDSNTPVRSSLRIETIGSGDGGNINISTSRLLLSDGGSIANLTYGQEIDGAGAGGDINILATDAVEILGVSSVNPELLTIILAGTFGAGNAGNLTVSTRQLRIVNGASLSGSTLGSGKGGEVSAIASDFIEIIGVEASNFLASNLSVFSFQEGDSSNLSINTPRLIVSEGGRVSASAFSSGLAGSVTINATQSVKVSGTVLGSINPSTIDSSATTIDESLQQIFSTQSTPTGDTGELTINTPRLMVADGARIGVEHQGTGNAGALRINASEVLVEGGASITAASTSGLGGNISIHLGDSLLLRNGGRITAEAGGSGDGGNLTINAETIVLLENSTIDASALKGAGGNIRITARGLFPSDDSAITASSLLGVDGTIELEGVDSYPSQALLEANDRFIDPATLVIVGCEVYLESEFTVIGRSGLPPRPTQPLTSSRAIVEWASPGENEPSAWQTSQRQVFFRQPNNRNIRDRSNHNINRENNLPLVEATKWIRRPNGVIELVADSGEVRDSWYQMPDCHSIN